MFYKVTVSQLVEAPLQLMRKMNYAKAVFDKKNDLVGALWLGFGFLESQKAS